ncbi:MAG: glycosyltransferase [Candidatus Sedimenticola sp. (ex Thyasira tokunagai)]
MRNLMDWLANDWSINIYSLNPCSEPSPMPRVSVFHAKPLRRKRITIFLNEYFDNLVIRYLRRGFNTVFEYLIRFHKESKGNVFRNDQHLENLRGFLQGRDYDLVIVEYINNTYLLEAFGDTKPPAILDMHDLMHVRAERFREVGITPSIDIDRMEEYRLMRNYDLLMAIQAKEAGMLREEFSDRVVVVRRPQQPVDCPLPDDESPFRLLFLASKALFNLHAYDWFVSEVWPHLDGDGMELLVAGSLCNVIGRPRRSNIRHLGLVDSLQDAYSLAHVSINPVQAGSGLKIKNLEALAHGRVMLTTPLGAEGMEDAVGHGLLVVQEPQEMVHELQVLRDEPQRRHALGEAGLSYIQEFMSPSACFSELDQALSRLLSPDKR